VHWCVVLALTVCHMPCVDTWFCIHDLIKNKRQVDSSNITDLAVPYTLGQQKGMCQAGKGKVFRHVLPPQKCIHQAWQGLQSRS